MFNQESVIDTFWWDCDTSVWDGSVPWDNDLGCTQPDNNDPPLLCVQVEE